jgi:hypothetical protein
VRAAAAGVKNRPSSPQTSGNSHGTRRRWSAYSVPASQPPRALTILPWALR